jgi:hypothetical protein
VLLGTAYIQPGRCIRQHSRSELGPNCESTSEAHARERSLRMLDSARNVSMAAGVRKSVSTRYSGGFDKMNHDVSALK